MKRTQTARKKSGASLRTHMRHAFVPHKGNHYRPHLVRLHGVTAVLVVALVLQLIYGFVSSGRLEVLGRVSNISVSELVASTNAERAEASLGQLKVNEQLNQAAFMKAKDMFANNYWAHTSPTGVSPWKWLGDVGYSYDVAGENLAKNYPNSHDTVEAWMASESHRANILNGKYEEVGFAVVDGMLGGRDTTLVVAYYGRPTSSLAVQGTNVQPAVYAAPVADGIGNPLAYFGSALQSLSPATLGALGLFAVVGLVAFIAHHYRKKLPASWRKSWRQHHGLYTLGIVTVLGIVMIFATGGGQI